MLAVIVFSLIMLSMLDRAWRIGRLELLLMTTKHELLALKYTLQQAVIRGAISIPMFSVINNFLRDAIDNLHDRHLPGIFGYMMHGDLEKDAALVKRFQALLAEPENVQAEVIDAGYRKSILRFMLARHRFLMPTIHRLGRQAERKTGLFPDGMRSGEFTAALYNKRSHQSDLTDRDFADFYQHCS